MSCNNLADVLEQQGEVSEARQLRARARLMVIAESFHAAVVFGRTRSACSGLTGQSEGQGLEATPVGSRRTDTLVHPPTHG